MLQKLPVGIQTFRDIRNENYLYIDKTKYLCDMANGGKYFFLSRPRRFGKSLTLSTLQELFTGSKDLFTGLYAENNWDWSKTYPVIRITFNDMGYDTVGLELALDDEVTACAKKYGLELTARAYDSKFKELIHNLHDKYGKVVVLIDEYDKPIIDYLTQDVIHRAYEHRNILRNFYGVLKGADEYLKFVFLTGISKFAHTGIFSQLNNITDLTLNKHFGTMLGYTEEEIHRYFTPYLKKILPELELTEEEAWAKIKFWYNGYNWSKSEKSKVYNPFSILHFFLREEFVNTWFLSGSPKFLIDLLKENNAYNLDETISSFMSLDSYDLENLSLEVLMYQTGYLTFKEVYNDGTILLGYPNEEVRQSMYQLLLNAYSPKHELPTVVAIRKAFDAGNAEGIVKIINSLLASIPYDLIPADREVHFQAVIYIAFKYLGVFITTEVKTSDGRMDAQVETAEKVWILEFKLDQTADIAFEQIVSKDYAAPYRTHGKPIVGLGINFSSVTKKVDGWRCEEV